MSRCVPRSSGSGWPSRPTPTRSPARYAEADAELARRIAAARASIADVALPDNELRRIAALCAAFDVDGMRADLVVARTAVAHAAWRGAAAVAEEDIRVAAELALPHRRRRDPFDDPGLDPERLDEALAQAGEAAEPDPDPDPPGGGEAAPGEPTGIFWTATQFGISHPAQRGAVGGVPDQGAGGAGCRGGRARPALARPQPHRNGRLGHRRTRGRPRRARVRHTAGRRPADSSGRAVRAPSPTTCGARYGKAAKAIW